MSIYLHANVRLRAYIDKENSSPTSLGRKHHTTLPVQYYENPQEGFLKRAKNWKINFLIFITACTSIHYYTSRELKVCSYP